ncbi:PKD domain-containing protein [Myxococcota bacterium]|nr:PKD domain-containing protein [Myxococcota bacterium]
MSRLLFTALLLTSCADEVAPRADAGDPHILPVGATAALDGSFSEGDGLAYLWTVQPAEGATLTEPESPFATFTAEAPGHYTLTLEVCDPEGRCDFAETWARVDDPGSAQRISSWGIDIFAGVESGAGALDGLSFSKSICAQCFETASKTSSEWEAFCRTIKKNGATDKEMAICWGASHQTTGDRKSACRALGCKG